MEDFKENVIEFLYNDRTATVTFTQGRFISRIRELAKRKPEDVKIITENKDNSIVAHIPTSWIRINPPREYDEETLVAMSERARNMLNKGNTRHE